MMKNKIKKIICIKDIKNSQAGQKKQKSYLQKLPPSCLLSRLRKMTLEISSQKISPKELPTITREATDLIREALGRVLFEKRRAQYTLESLSSHEKQFPVRKNILE